MDLKVKKLSLLISALLMVLALVGCGKATVAPSVQQPVTKSISLVDDVGRTIEINEPVTKVVVASRYNNELIRAIGAIDKVVSVDLNTAQDKVYWSQFDPNNVIGKGQSELNYEKIVSLQPQILITPKNSTYLEDIKKLEPFGIKVVVVTGWDNANMPKQIEILGQLFNKEKEAKDLISFYQTNMKAVSDRLNGLSAKKTVYWEYGDPFMTCNINR